MGTSTHEPLGAQAYRWALDASVALMKIVSQQGVDVCAEQPTPQGICSAPWHLQCRSGTSKQARVPGLLGGRSN
jgi:hypothetical protein